jgi:hypothetical protein
MAWTYDCDGKWWMVYDDSEPNNSPPLCREVRSEEKARMLVRALNALALLNEVVPDKIPDEWFGPFDWLDNFCNRAKEILAG